MFEDAIWIFLTICPKLLISCNVFTQMQKILSDFFLYAQLLSDYFGLYGNVVKVSWSQKFFIWKYPVLSYQICSNKKIFFMEVIVFYCPNLFLICLILFINLKYFVQKSCDMTIFALFQNYVHICAKIIQIFICGNKTFLCVTFFRKSQKFDL